MFARSLVPSQDIEQRPEDEGLRALTSSDDAEQIPKKSRRHWYMIGAVAVGVGAAAALVRSAHVTPKKDTMGNAEMVTTLAEAACSGVGANCASTKCCKAGGANGFQCYAKNEFWAECKETCEPGVHPGEKEGTYDAGGKFTPAKWSCDELGIRGPPDPCSAPGEDCRQKKCCSAAAGGSGMTCFEKDTTWASCAADCTPGDWSCRALGNRTPYAAGCGWAGKSCADTHLCCNVGFSCVVKDATWTACTQTKKKSTWITQNVPIPAGWDGTIVGGGRDEYKIGPAAAGAKVMGTSLYCFMAFLPDSYEVGLHDVAKENKASIFACDEYDVFHSWKSAKAGWDTGEATLSNTDVFINVWDNMLNTGKFMKADWTVKVDADAVLIPDRLKAHIAGLRPPMGMPIYLKNNDMDPGMGNNGFLGAIEVFSKQAVQIYRDNKEGCHQSLGINAGEDGYFKGCMDALGVGFMVDAQLFNPDRSPGACNLGQRAGFHPLKTVNNWKCCLDITKGIKHNVVYGECQM